MNISDVNSEIIFPLELFVALTTRKRFHFPMYGESVSVESTLVFGLEVAGLAVKSPSPVISEDVVDQGFPLLECFRTIRAVEDLVSQPGVGLQPGWTDMLEGAVLALHQGRAGAQLSLDCWMFLLTVVRHGRLAGLQRTPGTLVEPGRGSVNFPGVSQHWPSSEMTVVTVGTDVATALVGHENVVSQLPVVLVMRTTQTTHHGARV